MTTVTCGYTWPPVRGQLKVKLRSTYFWGFAEPVSPLAEQFHLQREILVLFSPYPQFQARALNAASIFYDHPDYKHRLDKLCMIVVSRDERVTAKVQTQVRQDKELRVIVPFTYAELLHDVNAEETGRRFKSFFYTRDLFHNASPLKTDTYFCYYNEFFAQAEPIILPKRRVR